MVQCWNTWKFIWAHIQLLVSQSVEPTGLGFDSNPIFKSMSTCENTVLTLKWRVHVKQFNTENPHHSQNLHQKMREGTKLGYKSAHFLTWLNQGQSQDSSSKREYLELLRLPFTGASVAGSPVIIVFGKKAKFKFLNF